jgi:hypothetical protein
MALVHKSELRELVNSVFDNADIEEYELRQELVDRLSNEIPGMDVFDDEEEEDEE